MRVAIVHDYLTHFGGAERVLEALMDVFPHAPVFTLVYDEERLRLAVDRRRIRTSFLQSLPGARRSHRYFPLSLMPLAVEQFRLNDFDVVLSASHSFSKGILTGPETLHISYCFTPMRYAWDDSHRYVREFSRSALFQRLAPAALSYLRLWDYYAAQRVDMYLTLSRFVARRIRKYYRREAAVIPPPVNVNRFATSADNDGYYLIVSRLVPYKRIDLAIEACERLGRPLKIVGTGPEESLLRHRAGRLTSFLGFVPDNDLPLLYRGAKALLFPQEEDFGITALEAAASGKPTIAFGSGGAVETVLEDITGTFFAEQTADSMIHALLSSEARRWDAAAIRRHAERFSQDVFGSRIRQMVAEAWEQFQPGVPRRRSAFTVQNVAV
jgi:glycosyltransferase involved in cell wall biosynthesis